MSLKIFLVSILFYHFTFGTEYHPRKFFVDALKAASDHQQNHNETEHSSHGSLLSQKIVGGGIHDGNKALIQLHNYDSRNGLFLQSQYNGDIVNVVLPEQMTDGPEEITEEPLEPPTSMEPDLVAGGTATDSDHTTTAHRETTVSMEASSERMSSEMTSATKESKMTTKASSEIMSSEMTSATKESTMATKFTIATMITKVTSNDSMTTESKTTHDQLATTSSPTSTMSSVETTTHLPTTMEEKFVTKHPQKRDNPFGMSIKFENENKAENTPLTQSKDPTVSMALAHPTNNKAIVQQHFYDGRSGILMQNQYNGNINGMAPGSDFSAPLGLLMELFHDRSGLFRGKEGEQKSLSKGLPTASGSADAQVEIKKTVLTQQRHKEDQLSTALGLGPFLAYIRDMVSNDLQKTVAESSGRTTLSDPNKDSFVQTLFREGAKNANDARSFMERIMNKMGLNGQLWGQTMKDSPSPDEMTTSEHKMNMTTESVETTTESVETTTEIGETTTNTDVENFMHNIRLNSFNVGNGGQAYQIILENPDIKINFVQPEDHSPPIPTETTTGSYEVPWDILKHKSRQAKKEEDKKEEDDD